MNHTIGVVAHTSRAEQAHQLFDTVGATYLSMDNGQLGCERNHHQAWAWMNDFARTDWALVLEDDAQPVPDFNHQVGEALAAAPSPIVSLYLGKLRPPHWQTAIQNATKQAGQADANYITATHLLHAVAVAIRTEYIPSLLEHAHTSRRPWDYTIAAWALEHSHGITYTWPSLVDHADGPPAIAKHPDKMTRTPGRKAWKTGSRDTWTQTTVHINP